MRIKDEEVKIWRELYEIKPGTEIRSNYDVKKKKIESEWDGLLLN